MKGIELPINILVVVAVAIIVLLGVIALYFSGFIGPAGTMTAQTAKGKYCAMVTQNPNGCVYVASGGVDLTLIQITDFDANQDGTINPGTTFIWSTACKALTDNLVALLKCQFGIVGTDAATTDRLMKKACGCAI
jgi:hypothetical protein